MDFAEDKDDRDTLLSLIVPLRTPETYVSIIKLLWLLICNFKTAGKLHWLLHCCHLHLQVVRAPLDVAQSQAEPGIPPACDMHHS